MLNNLDWFGGMGLLTFLRDIGACCCLSPGRVKRSCTHGQPRIVQRQPAAEGRCFHFSTLLLPTMNHLISLMWLMNLCSPT